MNGSAHAFREDWLLPGLRWFLGGLFFYACFHKIMDPGRFAIDVKNYVFLPDFFVNLWAITLPWVDLLVGLALILGFWSRSAALVTALMYLSFIIAKSSAIWRGLDISCGCFHPGNVGSSIGLSDLLFSAAPLLLALPLIVFGGGRFSLDRISRLPLVGWPRR